jgi:hypothetical protein
VRALLRDAGLVGIDPARSGRATNVAAVARHAGLTASSRVVTFRMSRTLQIHERPGVRVAMSDVQQRIDDLVKGNRVVLFMKGTAQFPMCGFSGRAVQVLKACGVNDLKTFNVLEDEECARASRTTRSGPRSRSSMSTASSSAARTS